MVSTIIKKEPVVLKGEVYSRIREVVGSSDFNEIENGDEKIPYLKGIYRFFANNPYKIRNPNKVIIASDSLYNAYAAALYINSMKAKLSSDESIKYSDYDFDIPVVDLKDLIEVKILDLSAEKSKEFNAGTLSESVVFINGYAYEKDISERVLNMINALDIPNYVYIVCQDINEPYVQTLRLNEGYCLVELNEASTEYYEDFLRNMLDENEVTLTETTVKEIVCHLKNRWKHELSEQKIVLLLAHALDKAAGKPLKSRDFDLYQTSDTDVMKRLELMPGLEKQKKLLKEQAALLKESQRNKNLQVRRNLIFAGNPGTFKSGFAKMVSEYCSALGVSSSVHIEATREKLIGSYVGHTAPRIKKIFDEAKGGGTIVIDEAGWMIGKNEGSSSFVAEAVKEIVRYSEMPEYSDVTLIYNMYTSEVGEWLKLDDGLSSRIGQIVEFSDYSNEELIDIFFYITRNQGYSLEEGWQKLVNDYCISGKKREEIWGNGREMRKLCQSVIVVHALKDTESRVLTHEEIKEGINRLMGNETVKPAKVFGFRQSTEEENAYAK